MLQKFRSWLTGPRQSEGPIPQPHAATQFEDIPLPRVKKGLQAYPAYVKSTRNQNSSAIPLNDRRLASTDIARMNRGQDSRTLLRNLAHSSPDLSNSLFAYLRTAITNGYRATARNMDGTLNVEATNLVQQLLVRFDVLNDYSEGFSGTGSMRSNSESLAKEIVIYGGCSAELVLGQDLLPKRIQPISVTAIEFYQDKDLVRPVQKVGGDEINLDIPTFFYVALDMELMEVYPSSMFESAIKPSLFSEQFMADLQRVVRRAIHPRVKVTLNEENFRKHMPPEAQHDSEKADEFLQQVISSVEATMNSLEPDDALVHFDSVVVDMENNGNISVSKEYEVLSDMTNAKMSTGAKTLPAVLGHGAGSSNIASTETLLFMQAAAGAVQFKLNELYSRMLTLAIRLFGLDVYVEFRYNTINLRPEVELEAFHAQKQSRLLELLSLGMITDEEAAIELTGHLPPPNAPKLSGTMFKSAKPSGENPYGGATNDGSTLNHNLKPDTPSSARGENKKNNPVKE